MSAQSKTEEATPKKRKDSAEKGQTVKVRDAVVACMTLCGVLAVSFATLDEIGAILIEMMRGGFDVDLAGYVKSLLVAGTKVVAPVLLACIVATVAPSLVQSRFVLATKAIKINFGALDPIRGFKKIFSLRTVKDFVKSLLYLAVFVIACRIVWLRNAAQLFGQFNANIHEVVGIWRGLLLDLVVVFLACALAILILDVLVEIFIHGKDLRMAKDEVKKEHKETEGSPEIKDKRKQIHMELLSDQDKHDIESSKMIVANPTHVAVGIYFNPGHMPLPLVSICERNQRALAVRRYAEKVGVPVIVDVRLARQIYKAHKRYQVVSLDVFQPVLQLLVWLYEVEAAATENETVDAGEPEPSDAAGNPAPRSDARTSADSVSEGAVAVDDRSAPNSPTQAK
ncbi:EscU/YscU/HrcU family type III secretion system export apparatus switch protein [Burkholderia semiarida]|uniref:Secretion apparatus protein BsaZ n=1 Tax=Burkholderia semiarida TaxID=2843303 RepID=A0ABW7LGQ2_9BURK